VSEWIASPIALADDPAFLELVDLLELDQLGELAMLGRLHLLWAWAVEWAPDGDLAPHKPRVVARAMRWEGDATALLTALEGSGLVERDGDHLLIRNWPDVARLAVERATKARQKREARERARLASAAGDVDPPAASDVGEPHGDINPTSTRRPPDVHPTASGRNGARAAMSVRSPHLTLTLPDRTPDTTGTDRTLPPPAPPPLRGRGERPASGRRTTEERRAERRAAEEAARQTKWAALRADLEARGANVVPIQRAAAP
jgi:hypothetical protein